MLLALACSSETENNPVPSGGGAAGLGATGGASSGGSSGSATGGSAGSAVDGSAGDAAIDAAPTCTFQGDAGDIGKWPDSKTKWCTGGVCTGAGQDGDYAIHTPAYSVAGGVVTDAITGLEWRKAVIESTPWAQASAACAAINDGPPWRLPTRLELASLLDLGSGGALLQPAELDKPVNSNQFWTASEVAGNPSLAWTVSFLVGSVGTISKMTNHSIRCVRGKAPVSKLEANSICDVVSDVGLGLMWVRSTGGAQFAWADALSHCEGLKHAGFDDWRLPSAKELVTIVRDTATQPAIDQAVFGPSVADTFWSSSPRRADPKSAHSVEFGVGVENFGDALVPHRARCVRSLP